MAIIKPSHRLERILESFSENQLRLIMDNVGAIQLTEGCSSACPDCGVGALPGVRDFIPFRLLEKLFSEFTSELWRQVPYLYFASEPFDYWDGEHIYEDVHGAFEKRIGRSPGVITSLPRGKEKRILDYVLKNNSLGNTKNPFISALSITRLNYARIEKHLFEMIPQLEPEKQTRMASDYRLRLCDSYEDITEDGRIWSRIPKRRWVLNLDDIARRLDIADKASFHLNGVNSTTQVKAESSNFPDDETNSVYYFRLKFGRTPDNKEYNEIIKKRHELEGNIPKYCSLSAGSVHKTGRGCLYIVKLPNGDYLASESEPVSVKLLFRYLNNIYAERDRPFIAGASMRDFREKEHPQTIHTQKLGPKTKNLSPVGIGCFHGTILTPSGIYNVQTRKPACKYPYGLRVEPLEPDNFNVAKYCYVSTSAENISREAGRFRLLRERD